MTSPDSHRQASRIMYPGLLVALFAAALLGTASVSAKAAKANACTQTQANACIVTGSERGTYIQIGRDLAQYVAAPAGIHMDALTSAGSAENVRRLRNEPGVRMALVQSDVYQAFLDEVASGNTDAERLVQPLRVIAPLYNEEIYFVARADSPINFVHEIRDKRINIGAPGSGTALTATTLYRLMFGTALPDANTSILSNEEALLKLATERTIDVVVIVAGQPTRLFSDMKPEARQFIKLLKVDPLAPQTAAAQASYFPASIRASNYPAWLSADVPTLTTKALLVTYDYQQANTQRMLTRFAQSLCRNFGTLRSKGHAKWQEVSLEPSAIGNDWRYSIATLKTLATCEVPRVVPPASPADSVAASSACSQAHRVLGLCKP